VTAKLIILGIIAIVLIGALSALGTKIYMGGINAQVAADIAKANQNIATRRETDASFNSMGAAAVCKQYELKWVLVDGKSQCQ